MGDERVLAYAGASPLSAVGDLFREGERVVVRDGTELPRRCVLCDGAVAEGSLPVVLKFSWDSSFRVTKESTLEMRKGGSVRAYLCERHRGRWRFGRVVGLAGMVVSCVVMVVGVGIVGVSEMSDVPRGTVGGIEFVVVGFGMMIGFLFLFTLLTRTVSCVKIEGGYLYLRGVDEGFLAGLREVPMRIENGK